jgi:hypothetical protein
MKLRKVIKKPVTLNLHEITVVDHAMQEEVHL